MRRLLLLAVLVGAAVFAAPGATAKTKPPAPAPGGGKAPSFGGDIVLPGGQGAEPSLAIDTSPTASRGDIYAAAIGDSNGPDRKSTRLNSSHSQTSYAVFCL